MMIPTFAWARSLPSALLLTVTCLCLSGIAAPQQPPCSSPGYRQFDFWVGDWDVFDYGANAKPAAHVRVERMLAGCVLHERYEDETGHQGESFSMYDKGRNVWHQTWVTNNGQLLTIEGKLQNQEMLLDGAYTSIEGKQVQVRGSWKTVAEGVRETAVKSADAGKTWHPWFDLLFRGRSPENSASVAQDIKTVADMDTQFQAAVKANNAATIDRILAPDHVLVTGSGKVFDKSDELQDALSHMSTYEHQEEQEQTVRVSGSTAVVTARLWIKGTRAGKPIDYTLWFSDTYVRTPDGWKYFVGQASLPLPKPQ